jgi:hypothetical protein
LDVSAKETEHLFHVVDVVGADGELAIRDLEKFASGDDHGLPSCFAVFVMSCSNDYN